MRLSEAIKEKREALGMSQAELGRSAGVGRSTICRYESENRKPPYEILKKIADVLDIDLKEIDLETIVRD